MNAVFNCSECDARLAAWGGTGSKHVEGLWGFLHVSYWRCENGHENTIPSRDQIAGMVAATETCEHDWRDHPTGTPYPWRGCERCHKLEQLERTQA